MFGYEPGGQRFESSQAHQKMFDIKRLGLYALAVFFCLKLSNFRDALADRLLTCSTAEWARVQPAPERLFFLYSPCAGCL